MFPTPYICSKCLREHPIFHLSCPDCGAWNSFQNQAGAVPTSDSCPVAVSDVGGIALPRTKTNIGQLDVLLGDGFVPGSSVLLAGAPGAGKSTLVMQLLKEMNIRSLYVSGEESLHQLKLRADRLDVKSQGMYLLFETNVNKILSHVDRCGPKVLVIDSIQTMYNDQSDSLPGGPAQMRKCCYLLRRAAQRQGFVLLLIGQVTKGKKSAGPNLLEHAVDVVLYLDVEEGSMQERILRASKNRFGSTAPRCAFLMRESGLVFLPPAPVGHRRGR